MNRLRLTARWPDPRPATRWQTRLRLEGHALAMAWAQLFGRFPWTVMLTLTFDPKRRFPVNRDMASREAWLWCCRAGFDLRRPVAWVYSAERGSNGQWHAHVLLTDINEEEASRVAESWRLRNGHVDVRPVWGGPGAVFYVAKDGEIVFSDTVDRYRHRLVPESRMIPLTSLIAESCGGSLPQRSIPTTGAADREVPPEVAAGLDRDVLRLLEMPFSVFAEEGQPLEVQLPEKVSKETVWFVPDDRHAQELWRAEGVVRDRIWTARQLVQFFGGVPWTLESVGGLISRPEFRGKVVRIRPRLP